MPCQVRLPYMKCLHVASWLLALGLCLESSQAQSYLNTPQSIDGALASWAIDGASQAQKQEWSYAWAWSDSFLYLSLALPPNPQQAQALLCGVSWWIQPGGKKTAKGFRFPLGAGPADIPRNPDALHQALLELPDTYERFLPQAQGLELIHWPQRGDTSLADNPQPGLLAFAGSMQDNGTLTLEGRIPWSILEMQVDSLPPTIRFWAETGKLSRPDDLTRQDAQGISGGSVSNPAFATDSGMRRRWQLLDQYRDFSSAAAIKSRKLNFSAQPRAISSD